MAVIPENEKVIKLDGDDDEGWVDTHHGISESCGVCLVYIVPTQHYIICHMTGIEQTQEKLTEMKLEEGEKSATPAQPVAAVPLVGGAVVDDDSDSDDEPAVDIDEFNEPEDPVSCPYY